MQPRKRKVGALQDMRNTSTGSYACCHTHARNATQNISSTKPLSWEHLLLFTSLQVVTGTTNYLTGTTTLACSCDHLCLVAVSSQHKMLLENSNLFISCTPAVLGSVIKWALLAAGSWAARCSGDHRSVCKYHSGRVQPFGMRERKINATSPLRATGTLHLSNCTS